MYKFQMYAKNFVDLLMFAPPQPASSTHNAPYEQHSQSSSHHTTKEQTNSSGTAWVIVYSWAAVVGFRFNSR